MGIDQRGRNAVRGNVEPIDYRWGGLDPKEYFGKVKLMEHPTYGQRYFRIEDVENREGRGWVVTEHIDPTTPLTPTQDAGVSVNETPRPRPEVVEASPRRGRPRKTRT